MIITGSTTITGIFGHPVRHTFSPAMHNAGFKALALDFVYVPFDVEPDGLRSAVEAVRSLRLRGVNVTIPHKKNVFRFLDRIDPEAAAIGSVNTVVNENGVLHGYNTDAAGFLQDLREHGADPRGKTLLLVGAGGAGRAIATVVSRAGAKKIYITDSQDSLSRALAGEVRNAENAAHARWKEYLPEADILVNATPVGMKPEDPPLADARSLNKQLFVYDLIYQRRTRLLDAARKAGARSCGGLGMLLNQGVLAFELWTGRRAPVEIMRRALLRALAGNRPRTAGVRRSK